MMIWNSKTAWKTAALPPALKDIIKLNLIMGLLLVLAGCRELAPQTSSLPLFPSNDPELVCRVTVANPQALGGIPQTSITNLARPTPGVEPNIVRPYYLSTACLTGVVEGDQWGFSSGEAALADWRRFYPRRMQFLATDTTEASVLAAFPGGWCEVAGTAVCVLTGEVIGVCRSSIPLTAVDQALTTCPPAPVPPPHGGPCLEISCGSGDATCAVTPNDVDSDVLANIAFGNVTVGTIPAPGHKLILSHCGAVGDADTTVSVDGMLIADSMVGEAQFSIPIPLDPTVPQPDENECYPPDIANDPERVLMPGQSCTIPVIFDPQSADFHLAHFTIASNAMRNGQVDLTGTGGIQETLVVMLEPDTLDARLPAANNASVCMADRAVSPNCTAPRNIELSNAGSTTVTVTGINIAPVDDSLQGDLRFEVATIFGSPNIPVESDIPLNPGDSATFQIRWCGGNNQSGNGTLEFSSDDSNPSFQMFSQPVNRTTDAAGCQPPGEI